MTITRKQNGRTLEIAVSGKLNTQTASELERDLEEKGLNGAESLIWDFSDLDYISSAGIRVLLTAQNQLENPDQMKIAHPNGVVEAAFMLTGLSELLLEE